MVTRVPVYYFASRGRAESVRLTLEYLGLPYTDRQWQGNEWAETWKHSGKFAFEQVPGLEYCFDTPEGERECMELVQSHAIMRFLDNVHGTYGQLSPGEQAFVDMAVGGIEDFRSKLSKVVYSPNGEAELAGYLSDVAPVWLAHFERLLDPETSVAKKGGRMAGPYLCGAQPCHADLFLYGALDNNLRLAGPELLDGYPRLRALQAGIAALPNVAKYEASGRQPPNPNGASASLDNLEKPAPYPDATAQLAVGSAEL